MPTGNFQKTNWGWQLSQLQQQVGEWVELQLSRFKLDDTWSLHNIDTSWLGNLLTAAAWLLLGLVIFWLGRQLWRQFSPALYFWLYQAENLSRIANSHLQELTPDWLQRSQAYVRQGDYREACRCLYLAMLQHLNDTGVALHQPSRTDGEYLQLVQQLHHPQPYQTLIATHEQLCFGNAEISPETFDQCQQAYREIVR